jgi:UPF0271 protein
MAKTIDLNADLGEGDPHDASLLALVSSCNVACGGHAGDSDSMRATIATAMRHDVAIGAHPSYPDREHFGRRSLRLPGAQLRTSLADQLSRLSACAGELGARLTHVKPHGALYNDAADDPELAAIVAAATAAVAAKAALVGPAGSALEAAATDAGLAFVAEAFVDRAYRADGRLVPRSTTGSVYTDIAAMCGQAVSLAMSGTVHAATGEIIAVRADTLCVHGDTPGAAAAAAAVREALEASGIRIRAVSA